MSPRKRICIFKDCKSPKNPLNAIPDDAQEQQKLFEAAGLPAHYKPGTWEKVCSRHIDEVTEKEMPKTGKNEDQNEELDETFTLAEPSVYIPLKKYNLMKKDELKTENIALRDQIKVLKKEAVEASAKCKEIHRKQGLAAEKRIAMAEKSTAAAEKRAELAATGLGTVLTDIEKCLEQLRK